MSLSAIVGKIQSIPIVDATLSILGRCADAKVVGDKFKDMDEKKVNKSDIVNNLVTDETEKPLSANMGKELKKQIDDTNTAMKTVKTINLWVEPNVNAIKSVCYQCGKVCTVVFDFTTVQEISASGIPIFADLPKPVNDLTFEVHDMNNKVPYWLGLYDSGHISTAYVNNIPVNTRLFGAFTYIAE